MTSKIQFQGSIESQRIILILCPPPPNRFKSFRLSKMAALVNFLCLEGANDGDCWTVSYRYGTSPLQVTPTLWEEYEEVNFSRERNFGYPITFFFHFSPEAPHSQVKLKPWRYVYLYTSCIAQTILLRKFGWSSQLCTQLKDDVKYIWNNSYIWTAVLDQSEEWSSQYIFQFKQLERRSLKNQGFNGIRTRDLRDADAML